ncbi:MAG: hypothetical protein AAGJ81_08260 [Verrucomicrobiota bacterium]
MSSAGILMEYVDGFSWPVPTAFLDALSLCRFEQGDILHSAKSAYGKWGSRDECVTFRILLPERSSGVVGSFATNWKSSVRVEVSFSGTQEKKEIQTTQGNLYCAMWKGDQGWLQPNLPPPIPRGENAVSLVQVPPEGDFPRQFYKMSNRTNRTLEEKISRLDKLFGDRAKHRTFDAEFLGDELGYDVMPTVVQHVWDTHLSLSEIEELVKRVFYKPATNRKSDRDQFRLGAHGKIVKLDQGR